MELRIGVGIMFWFFILKHEGGGLVIGDLSSGLQMAKIECCLRVGESLSYTYCCYRLGVVSKKQGLFVLG